MSDEGKIAMLARHVEGGNIAAMGLLARSIEREHCITVEFRTRMPAGAAAFARWESRTVVVPPTTDAITTKCQISAKPRIKPAARSACPAARTRSQVSITTRRSRRSDQTPPARTNTAWAPVKAAKTMPRSVTEPIESTANVSAT